MDIKILPQTHPSLAGIVVIRTQHVGETVDLIVHRRVQTFGRHGRRRRQHGQALQFALDLHISIVAWLQIEHRHQRRLQCRKQVREEEEEAEKTANSTY